MKRHTLLSIASAMIAMGVVSAAGYGCGDDSSPATNTDSGTTTPETSTPETSTPETGTPNPPVPTLGAQIDRLGRPAINTALNHTFDTNDATKGAAKDAYNADKAQAGWSATYAPEQAKNLALFDGLDTNCGNQFLANKDGGTNLQVYGTLASVTADDRLWLDTSGMTCNTYLAVEANATKLIPNTDCGGRALKYDVIDTTYSIVAAGLPSGVTDGISADPTKTAATAFPYLATPLQ
jgi:hypothetical protein